MKKIKITIDIKFNAMVVCRRKEVKAIEKWRENKKKYNQSYKASNIKKLQIDLNINTDADIIEKLEKNKPVAKYIKSLIRNSQK